MSFQAIEIMLSALAPWKLASAGLVGALAGVTAKSGKSSADRIFQSIAICGFVVLGFAVLAVIQAQSNGNFLPFTAVWPGALLVGFLISVLFLAGVWVAERNTSPFSLIIVPIGSFLFGLFFLVVFFIFPRVVGFNRSTFGSLF